MTEQGPAVQPAAADVGGRGPVRVAEEIGLLSDHHRVRSAIHDIRDPGPALAVQDAVDAVPAVPPGG